ncbi:MAG: NAD(P)-binding domain-containing protein [Gammaproteobacteria bacterium]|nr:NAD(P)-binding domain-containing protein [Gammaproteobacteria bacterium]
MNDIIKESTDYLILALYLIPVLGIWWLSQYRRSKKSSQFESELQENIQAGLTEPPSLHPLIDRNKCIGCNTCAKACPEGEGKVLGIIQGKVELINPTHCIGHGACARACPVDAITLVFGTEKRGVEIPSVNPDFQTNVPGIFIAGELGGMGLIRNAITQGRQAMDAICKYKNIGNGEGFKDVIIVGAGPAGISASLGAKKYEIDYLTIEQESLGGTVSHYPRGKIVMTAPVDLPMVGKVKMRETTKEALLDFWNDIVNKHPLNISYQERMDSIEPIDGGFLVKTNKSEYRTRTLLLAVGRRGTPRKLGVAGEESSKVVYRLIDPEQYKNQAVLVVGGGDSALEAAWSIAEQGENTRVIISYRSAAFSRAKEKNRQKVLDMGNTGRIEILLNSNVKEIFPDKVTIEQEGNMLERENDAVIVSAGGILPTGFLKSIGIVVETKHGEA